MITYMIRLASLIVRMASQQMALLASYSFCTSLSTKHRCAILSKDAVEKNLPERFSVLVHLIVSRTVSL